MLQYIGTDKEAPSVNVTGLFFGNPGQLLLQVYSSAAFIIVYNAIATYIILKVISFIVPLPHGRRDAEDCWRRRRSRRDRLCNPGGGRVVSCVRMARVSQEASPRNAAPPFPFVPFVTAEERY